MCLIVCLYLLVFLILTLCYNWRFGIKIMLLENLKEIKIALPDLLRFYCALFIAQCSLGCGAKQTLGPCVGWTLSASRSHTGAGY